MSQANDRQVGGEHYRRIPGEQHWDRAVRLGFNFFQYMITKYVERAPQKNGKQDVEKALHFCQKWLECWDQMHPAAAEEIFADIVGHAAPIEDLFALEWLLHNYVMTETGIVRIGGKEFPCVKGKPTDFEYEGAYGDGRTMWTCAACRDKVYTVGLDRPQVAHECGTERRVQGAERRAAEYTEDNLLKTVCSDCKSPQLCADLHTCGHDALPDKRICQPCGKREALYRECTLADCPYKPRKAVAVTAPGPVPAAPAAAPAGAPIAAQAQQ